MIDAEMQALLSAYAAGTLTKEEEKRLFEKALDNQALFDALANEESMRATLASPLVKQTLLRALNNSKETPRQDKAPNHWLWIGLAAALFFATVSIYYWPTTRPAEPSQQVAVVTPAPPPVEAQPESPVPTAAKPKPAPPVVTMAKQEAEAEAERDESPAQPQPAKALKESPAVADSAARQAPAASGLVAANEERSRNTLNLAKSASPVQPLAEIFNNNLNLRAGLTGHLYAFLIDSNTTQPIATNNPLTTSSPRAIPLPAHSTQAEVWLIVTPTEDPVLARALTGVLPLPNRPWIKLKTN